MNVAIRVDSSEKIGIGHTHRCLKLAKVLKEEKNNVLFLSSDFKGNINYLIKKKYNLEVISKNKKPLNSNKINSHYYEWDKNCQFNDASKTLKIARKAKINFIIVDHYGLSAHWHKIISKSFKLGVIDDFLNKKIFSDYYINYHFLKKKDLSLRNIQKSDCKLLLGPTYALLNKIRNKKDRSKLKKNRVFIYLGSVDSRDITSKLLNCFKSKLFNNYIFTILIGKNNKNSKNIKKNFNKFKNFILIKKNLNNLGAFYEKNSFIISGTGVTLYEQIQHGCKILSIFSNNKQKKIIKNLDKHNLCKMINIKQLNENFLNNFLNSKKKPVTKIYFDGNGPNRIYNSIKNIKKDEKLQNTK